MYDNFRAGLSPLVQPTIASPLHSSSPRQHSEGLGPLAAAFAIARLYPDLVFRELLQAHHFCPWACICAQSACKESAEIVPARRKP